MSLNSVRLRSVLENEKRGLKKKLSDLEGEISLLDAKILDEFVEQGISSVKTDDFTIFRERKLKAKVIDKEALVKVLKDDPELSFLIEEKYNVNTLNARIREFELDDNFMPKLPEKLIGLIEPYEFYKIKARST